MEKRNEIYLFSASAFDVSVLVSSRRLFLYRNRRALDDRLPDSLHRASALRASALRQVGALAAIVSGAVMFGNITLKE